jgi:hypothetical protein
MSTEEYRVCECCGDATPADDWAEEEWNDSASGAEEFALICPSCQQPLM